MGKQVPEKVIKQKKRQGHALHLRLEGKTYQQIAKECRCSITTAWKLVDAGIREAIEQTQESSDKLREIELQRYHKLLDAAFPKALDGDWSAFDRVLKCMQRIDVLNGLEFAPQTKEKPLPKDPSDIAEKLAERLSHLAKAHRN